MRGTTEAINLVAQSWGRRTSARATRSSSPTSSTTPTSCRGSSCAAEKGATLRVAPVDDRGQVMLERVRQAAQRARRRLVAIHPGLQRARHRDAGAARWSRWRTPGGARCWSTARSRCSHMRGRRAGARRRLLRLLRPQDVRPDRHRRRLRQGGAARRDAALAGRRQHDRATSPSRRPTYQPAPTRFEAGTGNIADAVGLGAAIDYVELDRHRATSPLRARPAALRDATCCTAMPGLRLIGTAADKAGVLSFVLDGFAPEEVGGPSTRRASPCAPAIIARSRSCGASAWKHGAPVAGLLQHLRRSRCADRSLAAHALAQGAVGN